MEITLIANKSHVCTIQNKKEEEVMKKTVKATRLLIGAFLVALLLMVSVVLATGPGSTGVAEADGGGDSTEQVESFGGFDSYGGFGGGVQSMGVTWTGFD